jgi:hypothetical protein
MKFRILLLVASLGVLSSFTAHKFYVSITKVEFAPEEQSLQIISKIFVEDLEEVLTEREGRDISLEPETETKESLKVFEYYLLNKLTIWVDGKEVPMKFIGHKYEDDVIKAFIEVENISEVYKIQVENKMLTELFEEQQNIIHVKKNEKRKTLILDVDNPKGMLNFK